MKKTFLPKQEYKKIKRLNREDMDEYFLGLYNKGFKDGLKAGDSVDFKIRLVTVLQHTKGIGEKTIGKVLSTLKKLEKEEK